MSTEPLQVGSRFGGTSGQRFVVEAEVGRGGQAAVFRTRDTRLDRIVALKLCTAPEGHLRKMFLDRFERELKLTSRVNHPHVLQVYDAGELPGGVPYVLLEYMEFGSLVDLASQARKGAALPMDYLRYYATALAAGLRAVHHSEIIHRDMKPDNVLIAKDGVAKITDFGVALDISPEAERLTQVGQTVGTLGFMAPEQLGGLPGPQSDIFSYGITLYALVTGRVPPQETTSNRIPTGSILPKAWDAVPEGLHKLLQTTTAFGIEARAKDFDEVLRLISRADWTEDRPREGIAQLPPLPTGAYVSGQTGTLATTGPVASVSGTLGIDSDAYRKTEGFADTLDLTVEPPRLSDLHKELSPTSVHPDGPPNVDSGNVTTVPPPGPTRPMAKTGDADPNEETVKSTGPTPEEIAAEAVRLKAAQERAAAKGPEATVESPLPDEPGELPSAATVDEADVPDEPDEPDEADVSLSDAPTRLAPATPEPIPRATPGKPPVAAIAAAAVLLVAAIGWFTTRPPPPPDEAAQTAAVVAFLEAAGAGDVATAEVQAEALALAPADAPARRLVIGLDAVLAGDGDAAKPALSGLPDADPGRIGSEAALGLGAATRLASADSYHLAVASYVRAAACTGDCGDVATRAAAARDEACLVAPGGTPGCSDVGLSDRARHLAAASVLLADGHAGAAGDRAGLALAAAADEPPTCAEIASLRRLAGDDALALTHRDALAGAARAAARDASDCTLFVETAP